MPRSSTTFTAENNPNPAKPPEEHAPDKRQRPHIANVESLLRSLCVKASGDATKRHKNVHLKHINNLLLKIRLSCIARLPCGTSDELLELCAQIDKVAALTGLRKTAERVIQVPQLVTDDDEDDDPEYTAEIARMAAEALGETPPAAETPPESQAS